MSYKPYYEGGWQSGESGATPITPEALKHFDEGIQGALAAVESTDYPGCYYRTVDSETEWLNPPMVLGVEYRTAERWNGKAVYVKVCDFGALPNATTAYLRDVVPTDAQVVSMDGHGSDADGIAYDLRTLTGVASIWAGHGYIGVATTSDRSQITATVIVKYTK